MDWVSIWVYNHNNLYSCWLILRYFFKSLVVLLLSLSLYVLVMLSSDIFNLIYFIMGGKNSKDNKSGDGQK